MAISIGAILTLEELRVALIAPVQVKSEGADTAFPVHPVSILKNDFIACILGFLVFTPDNTLFTANWRGWIVVACFFIAFAASISVRVSRLVLGQSELSVRSGVFGRLTIEIGRIKTVQWHAEEDKRGELWLLGADSTLLVPIGRYASVEILVNQLSARGIKVLDSPEDEGRGMQIMHSLLLLLASLVLIWSSILFGPALR